MQIDYQLYYQMLLIRKFEEQLQDEFSSGYILGTTHLYIGQEANAVGIFDGIEEDDVIFSNHRCHGHFLAYGGDPYKLIAEIMGKETGLVGGRGGSQQIHWKNFYSYGIQGGIAPIATGMAFAEKKFEKRRIVLVFLGDGTMGEGVVYESLNIASLWNIPILFIVENNQYAQTTPIQLALKGKIKDRFDAFEIKNWECDTTDVLEIREVARDSIHFVRENELPGALIINSYRFAAHSKGDDFRDAQEISERRKLDPLLIHGPRLSDDELRIADIEVQSIIQDAFNRAKKDPESFVSI